MYKKSTKRTRRLFNKGLNAVTRGGGGGGKNAAEMTAALVKISFGVFHAVECGNLSSAVDRSDGSVTERRERVDTDGRAASRRYSPTRSNTYSHVTSCLTLRRTPVSCMSEWNEQYPLI